MPKFKIKAYSIDFFEKEIEAENQEKAEEKFQAEWENSDIESQESQLFLQQDEGFEVINEIYNQNEE